MYDEFLTFVEEIAHKLSPEAIDCCLELLNDIEQTEWRR